jgi:predicted enzyme related to lactoylglutathione lyase
MAQPSFQGRFIWHELMCTDASAAAAFYSRILPWKAQPFSPGSPYWIFRNQEGKSVAGAMRLSDEARSAGTQAHWRGYIGTADVDAIAGQAVGLGARIQQPVQDVPGVGRVALLTDPEGATFGLFCPLESSSSGPGPAGFAWNELAARNRVTALAFYQRLFGWQLRTPLDMGGGFQYQTFGLDQDFGGAYTIPADRAMPPSWCPYAASASADETASKVGAAGGQIVHGPVDVPGGGRIVQFFDAQHAMFAVHSMAAAPKAAAPSAATPKAAASKAAPKAKAKAAQPAKKTAKKKAKKKAAKRPARKVAKKSARMSARKAKGKPARKRARPPKRKAARKK